MRGYFKVFERLQFGTERTGRRFEEFYFFDATDIDSVTRAYQRAEACQSLVGVESVMAYYGALPVGPWMHIRKVGWFPESAAA